MIGFGLGTDGEVMGLPCARNGHGHSVNTFVVFEQAADMSWTFQWLTRYGMCAAKVKADSVDTIFDIRFPMVSTSIASSAGHCSWPPCALASSCPREGGPTWPRCARSVRRREAQRGGVNAIGRLCCKEVSWAQAPASHEVERAACATPSEVQCTNQRRIIHVMQDVFVVSNRNVCYNMAIHR